MIVLSFLSFRTPRHACTGLGLLLLAGCRRGAAPDAEQPAADAPATISVGTALATVGSFRETVGLTGLVVPRNGMVAQVTAPVAMKILAVHVVAGQSVHAGEPLLDLDRVAIDAELERATAVLAAADSSYRRAQRLSAQGILPRRDVEQAGSEFAQAKTAVTAAQRIVLLATLTAPITGVVTRLTAIPGASADPAVPLVEITNTTDVELAFTVSPELAARIRNGSEITLLGSAHDTIGTSVVQQIGAMVDSLTHGVAIRARGTRLGRALRLGETIDGELLLSSTARAVIIPLAALVPAEDGFQVFVVDSGDVARVRPVVVGGRNATVARILDGLHTGERVVTAGAYGLNDSVRVTRRDTGTP